MLKCRLCRAEQTNTKCKLVKDSVLEIVEALCIPAKVLTGPDAALCEVCSEKLHTLFQFKSKCISAEEFLRPYYSTDENVEISLHDILSKNKKNHDEDVEICRLCLNTTKQSLLLFNLCTKHDYQSVFNVHLPELNLKTTNHCHVCATCIRNLDKFVELTKCISTTQELMMSEDTIPEGNIPNKDNQGMLLIKEESIEELKIEDELVNNIININAGSDSQSTNGSNHDRLLCSNHPLVPKQAQQKSLLVNNNKNKLPVNLHKNPDNILKCNVCSKQFANTFNRNRHCRNLHPEHVLTSRCDYKRRTKADVKMHLQGMHRDRLPSAHKQAQQKPLMVSNKEVKLPGKPHQKPDKIIKCNICSKQFTKSCNLNRHCRNQHSEHALSCSQCNYKGNTREDVKLHVRQTHPGTIKCRLCHKVYHSRTSLNIHFLKHHTDTSKLEKLECFMCGFKTPFKKKLRCHIQRHQQINNPTDYKCESCNFTSRCPNSLYAHKRAQHGTDIFKCQLCEYTTTAKIRLKTHHNHMHKDISEVKLFTCSVCSFQTKYPASFATHQLLHKDPSTVTKYHCAHCSFKSIYRHKFSHHLKKKHTLSSKTKDFTSVSTNTLTKDSLKKSE